MAAAAELKYARVLVSASGSTSRNGSRPAHPSAAGDRAGRSLASTDSSRKRSWSPASHNTAAIAPNSPMPGFHFLALTGPEAGPRSAGAVTRRRGPPALRTAAASPAAVARRRPHRSGLPRSWRPGCRQQMALADPVALELGALAKRLGPSTPAVGIDASLDAAELQGRVVVAFRCRTRMMTPRLSSGNSTESPCLTGRSANQMLRGSA